MLFRSQQLGDQLKARLSARRAEVPQIADVRGLGAMVAVQFNDPATGKPDADFTKRVQAEALKRHLILLTCGVDYNVIRFLFPLTITEAVFAEALDVLDAALLAARG